MTEPPASIDIIDLRGKVPTIDRAEWPRAIDYGTRPLGDITGICLHYTAGSPEASPEAIALYQTGGAATRQTGAGQPFPAIAYTLIVDKAGQVYLCHDLSVQTWHNGAVVAGVSRNKSHVGICYIGNEAPNAQQCAGLRTAMRYCEDELDRILFVEAHKDNYPTSCPASWPEWRKSVLP